MATDTKAEVYQPRLNPFVFPSETTIRFVLLIVSVIGASLFIYSVLYLRYLEKQGELELLFNQAKECLSLSFPTPSIQNLEKLQVASNAFEQCKQPVEREFLKAAWLAVGGVGIVLSLATIIYSLFPFFMIRLEGMAAFDKQSAIEVHLKKLCTEMGIAPPPIFLQKPISRALGGRAFGSLGQYYVVLPAGLIKWFSQDREAFNAVLLHELSHLRNKDVDKTYFSVAAGCAFVIAALIPFAFSLLSNSGAELFNASWRVIVLVLLVYLTVAAVVRSREFYADVRASTHPGSTALNRVLITFLKPKHPGWQTALISLLEHLPFVRHNHWQFAFQFHPEPSERCSKLQKTDGLFQIDFWIAFGTGIAVTVAYDGIASLIISILRTALTHTDAWLESLVAGLVFAPLVVGIVGIGVWRETFASLIHKTHSVKAGKLGIGLGLGLILGQFLSFENITSSWQALGMEQLNPAIQLTSLAFNLLWSFLLLVSLYCFFKWVAASAAAWLSVAISSGFSRSLYIGGLIVAGIWLSLWFGVIFLIQNARVLLLTANSVEMFFSLILVLPVAIAYIALQPLTLIALITLWAFPLSAWLRPHRLHLTYATSLPSWVFLEQTSHQIDLPTQNQPQLRSTFITGLINGLTYCGLLLVIRLILRVIIPESVRDADWFKLILYFIGYIGFPALMQTVVAVRIARRVKYLNFIHGLFAAFTAGCTMTLGVLLVNLLFGGTINFQFAWNIFSQIVNWGALLALLAMLIVTSTLRKIDLIRSL
ncbi:MULTISPECIES: M48 family metalloprotease [Nostoc]|uniref:M48 family metalloprotease n=1 Tax=Nostoc paludosum FACHB-159 TaxID=2692908 RepID=A0ABR8K030_9NOSO|nr:MULTISPECIES: M48 family metalloprotease [Nostoc]MBD2683127.1 M48 family metalloprotease [Nostoc sp. FACHB-857]MBD2732845.1 M48 family metalloprotease [Nostoc paludosum FACHB-159]